MKTAKEAEQIINNEIKPIYQRFVKKILEEHPYINEDHFEWSDLLQNSLLPKRKNEKLTAEKLRKAITRFLKRKEVLIFNGFGNERLEKDISNLQKCGAIVSIDFHFKGQARFNGRFSLALRDFKKFKKMEYQAVEIFGYDNSKWILRDTFSTTDNIPREIFYEREADYKEFLSIEFTRFVDEWKSFLKEKEIEIKRTFDTSLNEMIEELKKHNYEWFQCD